MRLITKEAAVGATIIFDQNDDEIDRIDPNFVHNFVDVISLTAGGVPVAPAAGTYTVYVQTEADGGFKLIADPTGGQIDATKTGGSALANGLQIGASFVGNPNAIRVVPAGVSTAINYRVVVKQNAKS